MAERSGRIGGVWSPHAPPPAEALAGMARALGDRAQLLSGSEPIGDCDACAWGGQPLEDLTRAREHLADLDGAFALAWVAESGRALHLASDPIGHRRLYYAQRGERLVFASSLHGVLGSGLVPRELARDALPFYLSCAYVPGPRTLVEGVSVLPPGHSLEFDGRSCRIRPFRELPVEPPTAGSEETLRDALRAELERAVARALPPPGTPLGATLSGGIDSSLVLALARRAHRGPMTCYSVSFGPEHRNELAFSGLCARHCDVRQVVVEVSAAQVMAEFDRTVAALSVPNGDPLTVPNTLLFERAAQDTGVVLNGEGGDPCFGGPKNAPMLLSELLGDGEAARDGNPRARQYLRAHQRCYDDLRTLLAPSLAALGGTQALEGLVSEFLDDPRRPSLLDRLMAINVVWKGAYHILPKVDQLSWASGVRPRSPLFDRRIVELSFAIPAQLKRRGAVEKYLLKEAVRDLLPAAIVDRPKSGMLVPVEAWFRGPLLAFARERLLDGRTLHGLLDRRFLESLLDGQALGLRPRRGIKLWLLLTLEAWLRGVLMPR